MSAPWIVAFGALAICVIATSLVLLGTLRRISGVLEQAEARLRDIPPRPGPGGLEPGTPLPEFRARRFSAGWVTDADLRGSPALVLFVSSTCPACSGLLRDIRRNGTDLSAPCYLVVDSEQEVRSLGLEEVENVLIQPENELSIAFRTSTTPHAFAIDRRGLVVGANTPNRLRHLQDAIRPALDRGGDAARQHDQTFSAPLGA